MKETHFKNTEIGPIPVDWDVTTIENFSPLQRGFDLPTKDIKTGNIPVVYSNGICNFHNSGKCMGPGIVTGRSGTIGKFTFIENGPYWPHNTSLWVTNFFNNCPKFVYYLLQRQSFENEYAGSGVPSLNRNSVHNKHVAFPLKKEQEKIAEALSDVDALIQEVGELIEKKRLIKQGAMQQLLSGRTRLLGFSNPWIEIQIKEFATIKTGATPNTSISEYWGGNIRWMNSGELNLKKIYEVEGRITEIGYNSTSTHHLPKRCILLGLAGQGKTRGTCAINFVELCTNQSIGAIIPNDKVDNLFLYYYMDSQYENLRLLSSGDGGRGGLTKTHIEDYLISIPPDLKEQEAIAEVLSDMDNEITELESKREKYQSIKQGMMQELLTGRIRLVEPSVSNDVMTYCNEPSITRLAAEP